MTIIIKIFVILGFLLSTLIITGLVLDITGFDRTKGGYTAPYEGVTGIVWILHPAVWLKEGTSSMYWSMEPLA